MTPVICHDWKESCRCSCSSARVQACRRGSAQAFEFVGTSSRTGLKDWRTPVWWNVFSCNYLVSSCFQSLIVSGSNPFFFEGTCFESWSVQASLQLLSSPVVNCQRKGSCFLERTCFESCFFFVARSCLGLFCRSWVSFSNTWCPVTSHSPPWGCSFHLRAQITESAGVHCSEDGCHGWWCSSPDSNFCDPSSRGPMAPGPLADTHRRRVTRRQQRVNQADNAAAGTPRPRGRPKGVKKKKRGWHLKKRKEEGGAGSPESGAPGAPPALACPDPGAPPVSACPDPSSSQKRQKSSEPKSTTPAISESNRGSKPAAAPPLRRSTRRADPVERFVASPGKHPSFVTSGKKAAAARAQAEAAAASDLERIKQTAQMYKQLLRDTLEAHPSAGM